jgi:hypothetical protein
MRAQSGIPGRSQPARWRSRLACTVFAAAALGAEAPCSAASPKADATPPVARAEPELSRAQATALAQQRYGARVVRTDVIDRDGRHLYVFRLLSAAGKVWIVHVDARNGAEVP